MTTSWGFYRRPSETNRIYFKREGRAILKVSAPSLCARRNRYSPTEIIPSVDSTFIPSAFDLGGTDLGVTDGTTPTARAIFRSRTLELVISRYVPLFPNR